MIDASPYVRLIAERFPGVIVRADMGGPPGTSTPVLDVFMIPDDRLREFVRFSRTQFRTDVEHEGLPDLPVLAHGEAATRMYYPSIAAEADARAVVLPAPR